MVVLSSCRKSGKGIDIIESCPGNIRVKQGHRAPSPPPQLGPARTLHT